MKIRVISFVFSTCFIAGFWTACTIGFDPGGDNGEQFSCAGNDDCIAPKVCINQVCQSVDDGESCDDADDDGFGVGVTDDCPKCRDEGLCDEDCDDNDASVAPDRSETCDGKDNDCDGETDESATCETNFDCAEEQPYIPSCEAGSCVYRAPVSLPGGDPSCGQPVSCVGGMRESRPDECF